MELIACLKAREDQQKAQHDSVNDVNSWNLSSSHADLRDDTLIQSIAIWGEGGGVYSALDIYES